MDKIEARKVATGFLSDLLRAQPNLLTATGSTSHSSERGKLIAEFCVSFIERYADYLEKQDP